MEVLGAVAIGIVSCVAFVLWVELDRIQRALYAPCEPADETTRALSEPELHRARVVITPLPGASYPTLRMLDRARQDGGPPFADAPSASWLEQCARIGATRPPDARGLQLPQCQGDRQSRPEGLRDRLRRA